MGQKHRDAKLGEGARLLEDAVRNALADGRVKPFEFGGKDGTREITDAVLARIA